MSSPRRHPSPSMTGDRLALFKEDLRNEMMEMIFAVRGDVAENFEIAQAALQQAEVCVGAMEQHQDNISTFERAVRHDQNEVVEAVRRLARTSRSPSPRRQVIGMDEMSELTAQVESTKNLCISNTGNMQSDVVTLSAQVEHLQQQNSKMKNDIQTLTHNQSSFVNPGSGTIRQFRSFESRLDTIQHELTSTSNTVKKLQGNRMIDVSKKNITKTTNTTTDLSSLITRIEILEKREAAASPNPSNLLDGDDDLTKRLTNMELELRTLKSDNQLLREKISSKADPSTGPVYQASLEPNDKEWIFERILELEEQINRIKNNSEEGAPSKAIPEAQPTDYAQWLNSGNITMLESIMVSLPKEQERIKILQSEVKSLRESDETLGEELQMLSYRLRDADSGTLDTIVVEVGKLKESISNLQSNGSDTNSSADFKAEMVRRSAALEARLDSVFNTVEILQMKSPPTSCREPDPYLHESPSPQLQSANAVDFIDLRSEVVELKEGLRTASASIKIIQNKKHSNHDNDTNQDSLKDNIMESVNQLVNNMKVELAADMQVALSSMPQQDESQNVNELSSRLHTLENTQMATSTSFDEDALMEKIMNSVQKHIQEIQSNLATDLQQALSTISPGEGMTEDEVMLIVNNQLRDVKQQLAADMQNALQSVNSPTLETELQQVTTKVGNLSLSNIIDELFTKHENLDCKFSNLQTNFEADVESVITTRTAPEMDAVRRDVDSKLDNIKNGLATDMKNALDNLQGDVGNKPNNAMNDIPSVNESIDKLSNDLVEIMEDVGDLSERMELVEDQLAKA